MLARVIVYLKFTQVEEELWEQEFLERCFQEMLEEEDQDWFIPARDLPSGVGHIQQQFSGLSVNDSNAEDIAVSSASFNTETNALCSKYSENVIVTKV